MSDAKSSPSARQPVVRVGEVMNPEVRMIDGLATVDEAIAMMAEHSVSCLVVDRRHDDDEYGMVLVHDIAEKVIGPHKSPERVSVYEIMSKPVLTVDADMDIRYAIRLLTRFNLHRAIITREGKHCGIATLRDMAIRSRNIGKK